MFRQYAAIDVAQYFVRKGIQDALPVTQMKLQKLVYFAHGLFLAETQGCPLIVEEFEAWKFGPVVPQIYHAYKFFGNGEILNTSLFYKTLPSYNKEINFDDKAKEIIDLTWDTLRDSNAIQLSNWTHRENSAWHKVYKENVRSVVIPNDKIQEDFQQFLEVSE